MKMFFWNIQSFKPLERNLIRLLDEEINNGERIRSIKRLVSYIFIAEDNNDIQCMWVRVKDDSDARTMMFGADDIVLIVVIS